MRTTKTLSRRNAIRASSIVDASGKAAGLSGLAGLGAGAGAGAGRRRGGTAGGGEGASGGGKEDAVEAVFLEEVERRGGLLDDGRE